MVDFAPLLAQESLSVVPTGYSFALLRWLTIYVVMLFAWGIMATSATMNARRMVGRSVAVRYVAAVVGLIVFVAVPALAARLLLPSAVLLAAIPFTHSTLKFYRRQSGGLMRAVFSGIVHTGFLAYRLGIKGGTIAAEVSWAVVKAVTSLDWDKLKEVPDLARQTVQRFRPAEGEAEEGRDVVLLQPSGLPLDINEDPRLKSFSKAVPTRLVSVLREAVGLRASEVLLTVGGQAAEFRFRIDGAPVAGPAVSLEEAALLARAIKVLAGLNVSKTDHAQEGTIPIMCGDLRSEVFVTTAPSSDSETLVLRIAADERLLVDGGLGQLGFDDAALAKLRQLLGHREGLIVFTGRPDAGRSTTIYAAVAEAIQNGRSVATVEATPQHHLVGVPQTRPNNASTSAFVTAIDTALRHDPDVLVVRDVLDRGTAEACMRAAVSGRLVLVGLPADNATTGLQRLLFLGVDRALARMSLTGIVSQRLVRVLCDSCKASYQPPADVVAKLGLRSKDPVQLQREVGCPKCRSTGFKGRSGIFELMVIDESARNLIGGEAGVGTDDKEILRKGLVRTLQQSAMAKVVNGTTSVQEVARTLK